MADYSKFKNSNGDDLVLKDSRVDDISEKVEGIETGAEVNKIESISIEYTELEPDVNKNVNIKLGNGLNYVGNELSVKYDNDTIVENGNGLEVAVPVPDNTTGQGDILCWQSGSDYLGIEPHAVWCSPDSNDILVDTTNGEIRLAVPVPDPKGSHPAADGDVLTYDGNTDEIVWAAPQGGSLPSYTQSDAGKVLAVNQAGNGVEWTNAGGGGGDDADTLIVTIDVKDGPNYSHIFESATKSPWEAYQAYKNGKTVFANIRYLASNNEVYNVYSLPLSYLYYSDGILPVIYFVNYGVGSGSTSERIMLYNVEENDTWDNADSTFWS